MNEPHAVLWHVDERGIAHVTLNRPAVNNAYNDALLQGLAVAFAELAADDKVRLVILRGNGRHFQAGADLAWIRETSGQDAADNLRASRLTAEVVRGLNEFAKPTMALIQGACIGGGTGVAAACDIVIASDDAVFAISEVRWGLAAHIIFPQLNAAIGARNVRRYAITCERFSARIAKHLGLVHEVCATGELELAARPVIESLLHAAPQAVVDTKHSVMACANAAMPDTQLTALAGQHAARRQTAEAAEGLASFLEKREPSWYPGPRG